MRYLWTLTLLACAFVAGCRQAPAAEDGAPPVFGARPRLSYTPEEVTRWKADPARQAELRQTIARGDQLLQQELVIPQQEGQWIFYYACPKDDNTLKAETPERHVCPTCKAVYSDERTNAAYRTQLYYQLDNNCLALAQCYALTGDDRYAVPVRRALLELARLYPTFERHDRWGRRGLAAVVGGRRYAQHLDEAVASITLARAYDLIAAAPILSDEDRAAIEQKLLGDTVREIRRLQRFIGSRNNHQTWFNAAYATVGVAIGDAGLLRDALYGPVGLLWQLDHSVTSDGIWYEGAMAYHFYALQAIMDTLSSAKRAGWDFRENARVKSLWLGPIQLAYPNGQFPVINDSDPVTLQGYQSAYRWAFDYFQDPVFAAYAGVQNAARVQLSSANLTGIGLAVLRRGSGEAASCAMVDYGQHGDHHGHPDKLGLVLYGLGRELLLDPGRISYSVPEYNTWCRTTVAHNTVVINGVDQKADTGQCLFFAETPQYAATLTASDGAYPGYALRRFLLLTETLLIDVFTVSGKQAAQCDWLAHAPGTLTTTHPLAERTAPLGDKNGYQHLTELRQGAGAADRRFTVEGKGAPWRLWCLDDADTTIVTGMGIGYHLRDRVPFLLRRRTATATAFVTVYDLAGAENAVTSIEQLPVQLDGKPAAATEGCGLRIRTARGTLLVGLDLRDKPAGRLTVEQMTIDRCLLTAQP